MLLTYPDKILVQNLCDGVQGKYKISWTANPLATSYKIYRNRVPYGPAELIAETSDLEYIDTQFEVIDNTAPGQMQYTTQIQNVGDINQFGSSYNTGMVNEITKDVIYTTKTLPVKVMETKVNKVIVNNNINTLPVVYGEGEGQVNYSNNY